MIKQAKAKIFLADERGCSETDSFRTYSTFNFLEYFNEHKKSFNGLYAFNENTLAAGHCLQRNIQVNSIILLVPVVGTLSYKDTSGTECFAKAGQMQTCYVRSGSAFNISNPVKDTLINFLEVWIQADLPDAYSKPVLFDFDLNENKNGLTPVITDLSETENSTQIPLVTIGKFGGRQEALYRLENGQSSLFVFVIEGVFEVQGRLLHSKDSLGLWNETANIELEALSNNAIVLTVELNKG